MSSISPKLLFSLLIIAVLIFLGFFLFTRDSSFFSSQKEAVNMDENTAPANKKEDENTGEKKDESNDEEKYVNTIFDESVPFKKMGIEWEEYTSKEYGFSMKYPKSFILDKKQDVCFGASCFGAHFWSAKNFQEMEKWRGGKQIDQSPNPDISIYFENRNDSSDIIGGENSIEKYIEKNSTNIPFVQIIDIDGENAWVTKNQHGYPVYYIYTIHDEKIYEIFIKSEDESIITLENILDFTREFLSNFKFIQ